MKNYFVIINKNLYILIKFIYFLKKINKINKLNMKLILDLFIRGSKIEINIRFIY